MLGPHDDSRIPVEDTEARDPGRSAPPPRPRPERTRDDSHHSKTGIKASAFSPGYFERFFVTERELGRGGKGVVLLVRHVLDGVSLGHFACKRVPVGNNHDWLEKVLLEVQLLQRLSHPNLVSYRHVWLENAQISAFGPSVACAFILQQYCNAGDLHHYVLGLGKPQTKESLKERLRRRSRGQPDSSTLHTKTRSLPFKQIIAFFRDIASALQYLHSNGFIHRDLKPSNCLLHDTGIPGQELKVLVSDFGEVQIENQARQSTGNTGTISYCAPEVLKRVTPGGAYENFTTKSDIFSLGMILHFLCFGKLPYVSADQINEENEDLDALREEISAWRGLDEHDKIRADLPEQLYHSLKALINPDPSLRPSAEDILLGIELNVGEESPPLRRGSVSTHQNPSVIDESHALGVKRISPIADTPRSMTPVDPTAAQLHRETAAPRANGKATTASRKTSKLNQIVKPPGSPPASPDIQTGTAESSIILRPRMESPKPLDTRPAVGVSPVVADWRERVFTAQSTMLLKFAVFFLKLLSLTRPCVPAAPRPFIFYPIVMLATLDFMASPLMLTAILGLVHMGLLYLATMFGGLCMY